MSRRGRPRRGKAKTPKTERRAKVPLDEPDDPIERIRLRRRHPAERLLSRTSGFLLLLMIAQAAFGYGMVAQAMPAWVRAAHFALAFVVALLALFVHVAVRRLPWKGRRELGLYALAVPLLLFTLVQLVSGLMARGWFPGYDEEVRMLHIGVGLLVMLLITLIHVLAIGPSLALSARREYEANREEMQRQG